MIRSSIKIGKSRKSSYLDGPWDSLSVGLSQVLRCEPTNR